MKSRGLPIVLQFYTREAHFNILRVKIFILRVPFSEGHDDDVFAALNFPSEDFNQMLPPYPDVHLNSKTE